MFAWRAVRHITSLAVVVAKAATLVGIGAGQSSRLTATEVALHRAADRAPRSVLASDAYFPFGDAIALAAERGVTAIIQPGGSVRDEMAIEIADRHHLAMVFTGGATSVTRGQPSPAPARGIPGAHSSDGRWPLPPPRAAGGLGHRHVPARRDAGRSPAPRAGRGRRGVPGPRGGARRARVSRCGCAPRSGPLRHEGYAGHGHRRGGGRCPPRVAPSAAAPAVPGLVRCPSGRRGARLPRRQGPGRPTPGGRRRR